MKVLHVIAPGPMAGAEKSAIGGVAALLNEPSVTTDLLVISETRCLEHGQGLIAAAKARNIECLEITTDGRFDWQMVFKLGALLRAGHYQVVHVHSYKALFYLCFLRHQIPKLVATYHGTTSHTPAVIVYEFIQWVLYQQVDSVFAVSEGAKNAILSRGKMRAPIAVVPNMLSEPISPAADLLSRPPQRVVQLLFMGRLSIEKGLDVLLEALARFEDKSLFHLTVLGDGPKRRELERLAADRKLRDHVQFLGFQTDIRSFLGVSDVLVMPSRTEGLPMALIEAAAAGIPVVGSSVGGIPEVVKNKQTGLLVTPDDSQILFEAIFEMVRNVGEYQIETHNYASEILSLYSPQNWARKAIEEYNRAGNRC